MPKTGTIADLIRRSYILLVFVLSGFAGLSAQTPVSTAQEISPDSLKRQIEIADSLSAIPRDDNATPDSSLKKAELDTIVNYSAEEVHTIVSPRKTVMKGKAKVTYKNMELEAEEIEVLWEEDLLYARGALDTVKLDSSRGGGDSTYWKGLPKMKDGSEIVDGFEMVYNFKTRRGKVIKGDTKYEDGFMHGNTIKKVDEDVLNVRDATYTTCDLAEPHYHFWSRDLKLIVKDKVIARPVVLCFGPVPVMIIPFAVFPARGGRHSGLIIPTYGETADQGRYFRNLGYYWAPNDYMDVTASMDYREQYGIQTRGYLRYAKRYRFTGNLNGSFINERYESRKRYYDLYYKHSHTLSPSASLNIDGKYVSDLTTRKELSYDPYERMSRTIESKANITKRWPGTPYSGSVYVSHHEILTTGAVTQELPQIRFSRGSTPVFPQPEGARTDDLQWFNKIYFSYNNEDRMQRTIESTDSSYWDYTDGDTTHIDHYLLTPYRYKSGIDHKMSLSASVDFLKYFSLTPGISYRENWFDEWLDWQMHENGKIDSVKNEGFKARRTFSGSMGINTTLYGLFHPRFFGIEALRHKVDPSVSFSYTPDFSEPRWGYYDVFTDSLGRERKYDRFKGNLFGGTPSSESRTLSLTLNNLFQYKLLRDGKEIKGDLFNLNLGTSHNFAADSLKWSNLSSNFGMSPNIGGEGGKLPVVMSGLRINVVGTHSFYDQAVDPISGYRTVVNRAAPEFLRLVNFNLSTSFTLKPRTNKATLKDSLKSDTESDLVVAGLIEKEKQFDAEGNYSDWEPSPLPWETSFGLSYNENHNDPNNIIRNTTLRTTLSVDVTKNWDVTYTSNFDLDRKVVTLSSINIHRDLHCWDAILNWTPTGAGKGYYLRIAIKSPMLQDVKVEKRKGKTGVLGY